jgi:ATP-binding cassette subfamily B protein
MFSNKTHKVPLFSDQSFNTNIRGLWVNAQWALTLTWSTSARLTMGVIGSYFVQSLVVLGFALSSRGIVNAVVNLLGNAAHHDRTLVFWIGIGLIVTLFDAASRFSLKLFTQRLEDEVNLKITADILSHAEELDLSSFENPRFQDIMERAQQDTANRVSQFMNSTLSALTSLIQSLSLIGLLVLIDYLIVLIMLPIALPYLLYQWRLSKTRYHLEYARAAKRRWTHYYVGLLTNPTSVPEVKLLGLGSYFKQQFTALMHEFRDQDRRLYLHSFVMNLVFSVISIAAAYAVFMRVAFRVGERALTVGDVAIFGGAAVRLRASIEHAIWMFTDALEQMLYISNLIEYFHIQPRINRSRGLALPPGRGEIEFKKVIFTYPGSNELALKDISLVIKPGETVALVGENGAGKTTLVKLIARLYDPVEGSIFFDGIDLQELSLVYLHSQISFVFQLFARYEATVGENIAYGDLQQALNNTQKIERIARRARVHNLIQSMPQGYDTLLGRMFGEFTLSEGQWQQIALARALARDAPLLILDEPTSNLDARSEHQLFSRFQEIAHGRTTILISHRFSTVSMADRILVMDKGQIVEQGSHHELVVQGGHYASLYRLHQRQMDPSRQNT